KYCLTATAKKHDMRVIAVVMGADKPKERNAASSNMLDYAFNHFETKKLFEKGQTITNLKDLKAEKKNINIVASPSISTLNKKGELTEDTTTPVILQDKQRQPMQEREEIGRLHVNEG